MILETLEPLIERIQGAINKYEDPRTSHWPLMSSPFPTITITFVYFFIIKVLAPMHMKNRKPYDLQKVLIGYNFFQVILSAWMFHGFCTAGWFTYYNLRCQSVEIGHSTKSYKMNIVSYVYYLSKFTEFADTVLFILRKKDSQVTSLHIFHHSIMPLGSWIGVKYAPDGNMTLIGLLNSFVHIIMYTYYMLSAMGPKVQKYLWWKQYITATQLVQFVAIDTHAIQSLASGCKFPKPLTLFIIFQSSIFLALFWFFYKKAYYKHHPIINGISNGDSMKYSRLSKTSSKAASNGISLINNLKYQ